MHCKHTCNETQLAVTHTEHCNINGSLKACCNQANALDASAFIQAF